MDDLLDKISELMATAQATVEDITSREREVPDFVTELLSRAGKSEAEGVSLLDLKTSLLVGYINNVAMVVLEHLQRLDGAELDDEAVKRSIVHRVTLEKGVKPLEKKLAYQLDKMVRTFTREQQRIKDKEQASAEAAANSDSDDDSELEDELNYKPDTATTEKDAKPSLGDGKYRPPKLLAVAMEPRTEDTLAEAKTKKLQSMEEYLREQLDAPLVEALIGTEIVLHGRGGVKTAHDRRREQEIQTFEEENFTRLPDKQLQKSKQMRRKDQMHTFGGEDFSIFNSGSGNMKELTLRKRKATLAWDRAKRQK